MSPAVKSPTLYRLAADRQYDRIPEHIQSHPSSVYWTDRYGSTALHILCQAQSLSPELLVAVDHILAIAPEIVAWPNVATWTPLHFATERRLVIGNATQRQQQRHRSRRTDHRHRRRQSRFHDDDDDEEERVIVVEESQSTMLILRLIRACPQAVSISTQSGCKTKTPFHIACESNSSYKVLYEMLHINPQLATEPFVKRDIYAVSENPIQILWKHQQAQEDVNDPIQDKMALLLHAAHYRVVPNKKRRHQFRLLNAACSVRCPREYFVQVLKQHSDQVSTADSSGLFPLYYAVRSACPESQSYTQFVIESLLDLYPQAAGKADSAGRLPLHVALESGMTYHKGGISELTAAYPNALRRVDPETQLLPFQAAATTACKSRLHLSTLYELLLAAPETISREAMDSLET